MICQSRRIYLKIILQTLLKEYSSLLGVFYIHSASEVAQWSRIHLSMRETQETWVQSLGREDPLRRKWQSTQVSLAGKFHELRSLVVYGPWCDKELNTTEQLSIHNNVCTHTQNINMYMYISVYIFFPLKCIQDYLPASAINYLSLIITLTHFSVSVLEKQKLNYKTFIFNKIL